MKREIVRISGFAPIIFLLVLVLNSTSDAASFDPKFTITSILGHPFTVTCIDEQKHIYEALSPGEDNKEALNSIEGILPWDDGEVRLFLDGIEFSVKEDGAKWTQYDEVEITYFNDDDGRHFKAEYQYHQEDRYSMIYGMHSSGVYELQMIHGEETVTYLICLDGDIRYENKLSAQTYALNKDGGDSGFASQIDLVNTANSNSAIYNILNEEEDNGKVPAHKQYQKIELDSAVDHVAVRIKRDVEIPSSLNNIGSTAQVWMMTGEKYVRVNGGEWRQFTEASSVDDLTSPDLELQTGYNVVEIKQEYYGVIFSSGSLEQSGKRVVDKFPAHNRQAIRTHVLLIHTDHPTLSSSDDNTNIRSLTAISYVRLKGDRFTQYETVCDEENDQFQIQVNLNRKYPQIIIGVDPVNPGASWRIVDDEGNDLNRGKAGKYQMFDLGEADSFKIEVTSADGSRKETKEVSVGNSEKSPEAYLTDLVFSDGGASIIEGEPVDKDRMIYTVDALVDGDTEVSLGYSRGAAVSVDGVPLTNGSFQVNPSQKDISIIKIVSEDGMNTNLYYLLYRKEDGTYAYFNGISDSTKAQAKDILTGYMDYDDGRNYSETYWSVFMAAATGKILEDSYVYNVERIDEMDDLSIYPATAVLELCVLGENPYDFHGRNYVQELLDSGKNGFSGWAGNIWALHALKAAGYNYSEMDRLKEKVKTQAFKKSQTDQDSIDMASWGMIALLDDLSVEEKVLWAENVRANCIWQTGEEAGLFMDPYYGFPNANTHGCVLGALNALGVDPEKFTLENGSSPLNNLREAWMLEDGTFLYNIENKDNFTVGYNKDIIVGLGDIVTGSNVWVRSYVTEDKLSSMMEKAEQILEQGDGTEEQQQILAEALDSARKAGDITKHGEVYYSLQSSVKEIAPEMFYNFRMCGPETGREIDSLIAEIEKIGEVTKENAGTVLSLKQRYDSLPTDIAKNYVSNAVILLEAEKVAQQYQIGMNEKDSDAKAGTTTEVKPTKTSADGDTLAADTKPATSSDMKLKAKQTSNSITLYWSKIKGISGYMIYRYDAKTRKFRKIASLSSGKTSYAVKKINGKKGEKLQPATKYRFKVTAYALNNKKKTVIQTKSITSATCPIAIKGLSLKNRSSRKVQVSWKVVKKCSGYEIWLKQTGNKYKKIKAVNGKGKNKAVIAGLKRKKTYTFKVRAYLSLGKTKVYGTFSKPQKIRLK